MKSLFHTTLILLCMLVTQTGSVLADSEPPCPMMAEMVVMDMDDNEAGKGGCCDSECDCEAASVSSSCLLVNGAELSLKLANVSYCKTAVESPLKFKKPLERPPKHG